MMDDKMDDGVENGMWQGGEPGDDQPKSGVNREAKDPKAARAALVTEIIDDVKKAKKKHRDAFKRMRQDMDFAFGRQWSDDDDDDRYVSNVTNRHVQQRVATLYAKNPRAIPRRRESVDYTVWDGTAGSIQKAQQDMQTAMQALQVGMMDPATAQQMMMNAQAIMQDYQQAMNRRQMIDRIGKTLEIVYEYSLDEQAHSFKRMMKKTVRRALTCGVAYVKQGYQRVMERDPEIDRKISDFQTRLDHLQRMTDDVTDGELHETDAEMEEMRLTIQSLQSQAEVLVREGLTFDFPRSTAIIPDCNCRILDGFVGANRVAEEFLLTPDEIQEIYKVDIGSSYTKYGEGDDDDGPTHGGNDEEDGEDKALLWTVYDRKAGVVYVVVDGYSDFLEEPEAPEPQLERFWPWHVMVFNEVTHDDELFPPSDVRLMRPMQQEYNRSRESLREHRIANRPKTIVAGGQLNEEDKEVLINHPANAVIELSAMQPGDDVKKLLQAYQGPPIDAALYDVQPAFQDILRSVGTQEAVLGGTSGATATESSIAEGARMSTLESNVDDLDDLLTDMARAGSQILLAEMSAETAKKVAGVGAMWPEMTAEQIADELWLEIEAGSSGKPNREQEMINFERMAPLLMQIPGIKAEWLANEGIKRMDERIDLAEAVEVGLPSIMAQNGMATSAGGQQGAPSGGSQGGPEAQGAQGASNAPNPGETPRQPPRPGEGGPGRPPMQPTTARDVVGNG